MDWTEISLFKYIKGQVDFDTTTFNITQALNDNWDILKNAFIEDRTKIDENAIKIKENTESITELENGKSTVITGTLSTGQTTLTLSNSAITTDSVIDIYTDHWGVSPSEVTVETGQINMTFSSLDYELNVRAEVR